ncbi:MAG: VWA domain-containing protein [Dehalococcoidia bacterium]
MTLSNRSSRFTVHRAMASRLAVSLAGLVLAGVVAGASAQQPPSSIEVSATRVEGSTVVASLAVLDAASNPITDAVTGDFKVQIDGVDAQVVLVDSNADAALPLGIVLTVDTSGSMDGDAIASARSALSSAVGALRPGDEATLLSFAQSVVTLAPPVEDHAVLQAAIDGLKASGNTALFAGVAAAARASGELTQPRKAVVLLSDGEDFGDASGGVTRADALAAARSSGAPFFVVGLGREIDQQFLTDLAAGTGGQYFAAATPAELGQLYARISDRLRQQYTVAVELPDGLAAGSHQVEFRYGAASARSTFTTTAEPVPVLARFADFPEQIDKPTTLSLVDVPVGATAKFSINGKSVTAESNGRSVRLDPYDFPPGSPQTIEVTFVPADSAPPVSTTFSVAALQPKLLEPTELPDLQPGDLVRLTVQAQPGTTTASYLIDGVQAEQDTEPPYEFLLPKSDYTRGEHELQVVLSGPGGESSATFGFAGPSGGGGTNWAALLLLALLGLLILAAIVLGLRRLRSYLADREAATPVGSPPPDLASWVQTPRAGIAPRTESPSQAPAQTSSTWGILRVLAGPDSGKVFQLSAETELIGRGKYCTIRLTDSALKEAHFIVTSECQLVPSAPGNEVFVDDTAARTARLGAQATIRAGATTMEFVRLEEPNP